MSPLFIHLHTFLSPAATLFMIRQKFFFLITMLTPCSGIAMTYVGNCQIFLLLIMILLERLRKKMTVMIEKLILPDKVKQVLY
jgi:hypothetical protein